MSRAADDLPGDDEQRGLALLHEASDAIVTGLLLEPAEALRRVGL